MITLLIIVIVFVVIVSAVRRSRQEHVVKESLYATQQRSENSRTSNIAFFIISVIILFVGISMCESDSIITSLLGIIVLLTGIILSIISLVSMLKSIGRASSYKNMNEDEFKQHQEETRLQIKQEDEATEQAMKNYRRMRTINNITRYLFGG